MTGNYSRPSASDQPATIESSEHALSETNQAAQVVSLDQALREQGCSEAVISAANDVQVEPAKRWTHAELIRSILVVSALVLFATTLVLGSFVALFARPDQWQQMKELLTMIMPVTTAIVGATTTFYFGVQK